MSRNGSTGPLGMIIDTSTGNITGTAIEGSANNYAIKGTNSSGSDTTNLDSITVTASLASYFLAANGDTFSAVNGDKLAITG